MNRLNDIGAIPISLVADNARRARHIETWRDVAKQEIRIYDHDYGIELGALKEDRLIRASRTELSRRVQDACREPTALEILYYAQVGGPHVRGEA